MEDSEEEAEEEQVKPASKQEIEQAMPLSSGLSSLQDSEEAGEGQVKSAMTFGRSVFNATASTSTAAKTGAQSDRSSRFHRSLVHDLRSEPPARKAPSPPKSTPHQPYQPIQAHRVLFFFSSSCENSGTNAGPRFSRPSSLSLDLSTFCQPPDRSSLPLPAKPTATSSASSSSLPLTQQKSSTLPPSPHPRTPSKLRRQAAPSPSASPTALNALDSLFPDAAKKPASDILPSPVLPQQHQTDSSR
ncbi:hypothetical protein JCM8547_008927 [Rhodosporidiobolus lusitaniae]